MDLNTSLVHDADDPLFYVCWGRQSCDWCLQGDVPCSWCAVTSTCVPNPSSFPILAPLRSSNICPLGEKERWELRAVPLGCNTSTITFLTAVVSILGTAAAIAIGFFAVHTGRRAGLWWKQKKQRGFGMPGPRGLRARFWGPIVGAPEDEGEDRGGGGFGQRIGGERRPLLGHSHGVV